MSDHPTVELLYDAKGTLPEGPFYEEETNLLIWVDIEANTVNLLDVTTRQNRYVCIAITAFTIATKFTVTVHFYPWM